MAELKRTADEVLKDLLAAEVGKLLAGRTVSEALVLVSNLNRVLTDQAAAEYGALLREMQGGISKTEH